MWAPPLRRCRISLGGDAEVWVHRGSARSCAPSSSLLLSRLTPVLYPSPRPRSPQNAFGVQSLPVNRTVAVRWAPFATSAAQSAFVVSLTQSSQDATVTGRSDNALLLAGNTAQLLNAAAESPAGFYNGNISGVVAGAGDAQRAQQERASQRAELLAVVGQVQSYEAPRADTIQAISSVITAIVAYPQELSVATQVPTPARARRPPGACRIRCAFSPLYLRQAVEGG